MPFVEEFSRSWICNETNKVFEPTDCFTEEGDGGIKCYNGQCVDTNVTHFFQSYSHRFIQTCECDEGWTSGE